MSPVILACVLVACLIPQPSITGAVSEPGIGDNEPTGTHSHLPTMVTINSTSIVPAPSSTKNTSGPTSSSMVKPTSHAPSNSTTANSSSSTPRTSSRNGPTSTKPIPHTFSTSATHAGGSSSVVPLPTTSPMPPATTVPDNHTTTHHPTDNDTTTHHPTDGPTTEPKTAKPEPKTSKPTTKTTEPPQPVPNNNHVIHGLIAGIVIFALISVVLLVLLIFAGRVIYTKGDQYRRVSNNDDM